MQDQYVGDIGDFGKYGLLRHLTGMRGDTAPEDALSLGVVWYLFPNDDKPDGMFIDYLCNPSAKHKKLRECDPELFDELHKIVCEKKKREIAGIQGSGVLPNNTAYYGQSLSYPPRESVASKKTRRETWLKGALEATKEAELVFVDPDNGITETVRPLRKRGPQYVVKPWHKKGPKYVFMDDLKQFYKRGQSLVIYHHIARWDEADNQIRYFAERLQECLHLPSLPWSLWYHRGTAQAYFIVLHESHKVVLEQRQASFADSPWCAKPSRHFERVT